MRGDGLSTLRVTLIPVTPRQFALDKMTGLLYCVTVKSSKSYLFKSNYGRGRLTFPGGLFGFTLSRPLYVR